MTIPTRVFVLLMATLTVAGAGLRLHDLEKPSLWADEMFTVRDAIAHGSPGYWSTRVGLQLAGVDIGAAEPARYDSFRALGMNEWNMRIGSCVVGILAIPLLGFATAGFLGRRAALILALLLAVSPWHLLWSQHARFYAPMFLYFSLALALYYSATTDSRVGWSRFKLAIAMGFTLIAVLVKPTSNLVLGIIGIDLALETLRTRRLPLGLPSLAILAIGAVLCVWATAGGLISEEPIAGLTPFLSRGLGQSPARILGGNLFLTGAPIAILAAVGTLACWRRQPRLVAFLVASTALPLAAFSVLSVMAHVEIRYTFIATFGWLALASLGLGSLWGVMRPEIGWLAASVPILLVLAGAAKDNLTYFGGGYGNRARWHHAFDYVERHRIPGEAVIAQQKWAGQFYLEDPSVLGLRLDFCPPEVGRCIVKDPRMTAFSQLQSDAWFVVKSTEFELGEGNKPHWLDDRAQMRAVFPNRIAFPQSTVRVYHYRPSPDPTNDPSPGEVL